MDEEDGCALIFGDSEEEDEDSPSLSLYPSPPPPPPSSSSSSPPKKKRMKTPEYDDRSKDVYSPSNDTFLLLDALEEDVPSIFNSSSSSPFICAEIGGGRGLAITFVGMLFKEYNQQGLSPLPLHPFPPLSHPLLSLFLSPGVFLATDINPSASLSISQTAHLNNIPIHICTADLLSPFPPRLSSSFDIIIFNPPYVPTESSEVISPFLPSSSSSSSSSPSPIPSSSCSSSFPTSSLLPASWAGGERGREVIDRILDLIPSYLSSRGRFYLVVVEENDPEELGREMEKRGMKCRVVKKRFCISEGLSILCFEWK